MQKNLQTRFSTRQYMLSRDFELYYYNEHYTSKVDTHTHDYYEFYFFMEGDVSIEIEGQRYPLRYGDMVVIPPHRRHRAVVHNHAQAYRRFVFWVSREYASRLMELSPAYGYLMQRAEVSGKNVFHSDVITFNATQFKIFQLIEEMQMERLVGGADTAAGQRSDPALEPDGVRGRKSRQGKGAGSLSESDLLYRGASGGGTSLEKLGRAFS